MTEDLLRIGDAERHQVGELLSRHFADGRLDQAELDERLGKALAAKTRRDLAGLLDDLPRLGEPPPVTPRPARRPGRLAALALTLFLLVMMASLLVRAHAASSVTHAVIPARLLPVILHGTPPAIRVIPGAPPAVRVIPPPAVQR